MIGPILYLFHIAKHTVWLNCVFSIDGNVYRGCVPKEDDADHTSPWEDGWESKNRCKTKDGQTHCTCR